MKTTMMLAGALAGTLLLGACSDKPAAAGRPYPLAKCIVSDEKLGSMGEPYVFVHEGQEIKLCCKGCLKDFNKEPAKYLGKLTVPPVAPAK